MKQDVDVAFKALHSVQYSTASTLGELNKACAGSASEGSLQLQPDLVLTYIRYSKFVAVTAAAFIVICLPATWGKVFQAACSNSKQFGRVKGSCFNDDA